MKTSLFFVHAGIVCGLATQAWAIPIAQWTFEVNTPADLDNSTTIGGLAADAGSGTASGFHASSATDWSTPAGNGSANSLSVNNWTTADYFQFRLSTFGYHGISISWDQAGTSTGPRDFVLQYSLDGVSFTQVGSAYQVALNDWTSSAFHNGFTFSPSLTSIESSIANQANVYFRLTDNSATSIGGATVSGGGTERIDNFTVNGTSVPESGSVALLLGLSCLSLLAMAERARLSASHSIRSA